MQIHIEFRPLNVGVISSELQVRFETGESIYVTLQGKCVQMNVQLTQTKLKLSDTFVGTVNYKSFQIVNKGDDIVKYRFTNYSTIDDENRFRNLVSSELDELKEAAEKKVKLESVEGNGDAAKLAENLSILNRTYKTEHLRASSDPMLLDDTLVEVLPVEGQIYPGTSVEISVIFKPDTVGLVERQLFCDVQGRELRVPIDVIGKAVGPILAFSFDSIDIGEIFVGSRHSYDVVVINKGEIDGKLKLVPNNSAFGARFTFSPSDITVAANSKSLIEMSFISSKLGKFREVFEFNIDGCSEPLRIDVKGEVIGPTLHIEPKKIEFGTVSLGFEHETEFSIFNTSLVELDYRIVADRIFIGADFEIIPSHEKMPPESESKVKLKFKPNMEGIFACALEMNVPGIGENVVQIPVQAESRIPEISLRKDMFDLGTIPLDYVIEETIEIINHNADLEASFILEYSKVNADLEIVPKLEKGVIRAGENLKIPISLKANMLGLLRETVEVHLVGVAEPLLFDIKGFGQGPEVESSEQEIIWGEVPVLTAITKTMQLTNTSLIPAKFHAMFHKENTVWEVQPAYGEIPPQSQLDFKITVNINDCIEFKDILEIYIEHGENVKINHEVQGVGTTIICEPAMNALPGNGIDLGHVYTTNEEVRKFKLKNMGRRHQQLRWTVANFDKRAQKAANEIAKYKQLKETKDIRYCNLQPPPPKPVCAFKVTPATLELPPGAEGEIELEIKYDLPEMIKENLICHSIIGIAKTKDKILEIPVQCQFINPFIEYSTSSVSFRIDKKPTDKFKILQDEVKITNVSALPAQAVLRCEYPFYIHSVGNFSQKINFQPNEQQTIKILFEPNYRTDLLSRKCNSKLEIDFVDHPSSDFIELIGEVNFPNLQFSTPEIDFGTILNDTEVGVGVCIKNNGTLPVKYRWWFEIDDNSIRSSQPIIRKSPNTSDFLSQTTCGKQTIDQIWHERCSTNASICGTSRGGYCQTPMMSDKTVTLPSGATTTTTPATFDSNRETGELTVSSLTPPRDIADVFNILPLSGSLKPGQMMSTVFSFFGHPWISANCKAVCDVEGGPQYETIVKGNASETDFEFSETNLQFEKIPFDEFAEKELILYNRGNVDFDFQADPDCVDNINDLKMGGICLQPCSGVIVAGACATIKVIYYPGMPQKFYKTFGIRVAHFQTTQLICLGEGVFPRVQLDLPRHDSDGNVEKISNLVRKQLENASNGSAETVISDTAVEQEAERLILCEAIRTLAASPSKSTRKNAHRYCLPDYILDFGPVILGHVMTHTVRATNCGFVPVNFSIDHQPTFGTGFFCELDRVKELPGFPKHEFVEFKLTLDPKKVGPQEVKVPLTIQNGPIVNIILKADVLMPQISISTKNIAFGEVEHGRCKVITMRVSNPLTVDAVWKIKRDTKKEVVDKHIPLHVRKAMPKKKEGPQIFEIAPVEGHLAPGEFRDVQVKFMPDGSGNFSENLLFSVIDSEEKIKIPVSGTGLGQELQILCRETTMDPIMPYGHSAFHDFMISNPGKTALEFFSVDFDEKHIEEDRVIFEQKGFDQFNNLILPPREISQGLPLALQVSSKPSSASTGLASQHSQDHIESSDIGLEDPVEKALKDYIQIQDPQKLADESNAMGLIIWGPTQSGKTTMAKIISERYGLRVLNMDTIIMNAINSGTSFWARRAQEAYEQDISSVPSTPSMKDGKRKSTFQPSSAPSRSSVTSKKTTKTESEDKALKPPAETRSITSRNSSKGNLNSKSSLSSRGEKGPVMISEDIIAELFSEFMAADEKANGFIFDGLECSFLPSQEVCFTTILRSLGARKNIFTIQTKLEFAELKRREEIHEKIAKDNANCEANAREARVKEMTEDEYDALPLEMKIEFDKKLLAARKAAKQAKIERQRIEREQAEMASVVLEAAKQGKGKKATVNMKASVLAFKSTLNSQDNESENTASSGASRKRRQSIKPTLLEVSDEDQLLMDKMNAFQDLSPVLENYVTYWNRIERCLVKLPDNNKVTDEDKDNKKDDKKGKKDKAKKESKKTQQEIEEEEQKLKAEIDAIMAREEIGIPMAVVYSPYKFPAEKEYMYILPDEKEFKQIMEEEKTPNIPAPIEFSVVKKPAPPTDQITQPKGVFTLVGYGPDDPNVSEELQEEEARRTPIDEEKRTDSKKTKRTKVNSKTSKSRMNINEKNSPSPDILVPVHEKIYKLAKYRWVLDPGESMKLRIRFNSKNIGLYESPLAFEIVGSRRRFEIACKGSCEYPMIINKPESVFSNILKTPLGPNEHVNKTYLVSEGLYDFGPLLVGKTKDRLRPNKYPDNIDKLKIINPRPYKIEINFSLRESEGVNGTFSLDQTKLCLEPKSHAWLSVFAFPKTQGLFKDTIICEIKDNPEPIHFDIACTAVKPEVEVDKKQVQFEKLLLHRKNTQKLTLTNPTAITIAWRLAAMENLGDEISASEDYGTIPPHSKHEITFTFRAIKPMNLKRTIRVEIGDIDNVLGVCQAEAVQVIGEAYDVALDMSFPRGADGGLDFGTVQVFEECKQACALKNKGKYEIHYKFTFESFNGMKVKGPLSDLFKIVPSHGSLNPTDRPTQVHIIFNSRSEIQITDAPIIRCHVIEPSIGNNNNTIASIPIKITAKSVFSKYDIVPRSDINFGAMLVSTKRSRTFTIENKGEFDFRYSLQKMRHAEPQNSIMHHLHGRQGLGSRDGTMSTHSLLEKGGKGGYRQEANQIRLNHGPFLIYPGFGTIQPGQSVTIVVDCAIEQAKNYEEYLAIDITDRDPEDHSTGVPYKLMAEGCLPNIDTSDISRIFEEHRIVRSLSSLRHIRSLTIDDSCYSIDENRFRFPSTIVGTKVTAKFRVLNPHKLPVDLSISVRAVSARNQLKVAEVFDVEPQKAQIAPHKNLIVEVSFCPKTIQEYDCIFEAAVECSLTQFKPKSLTFAVFGEGSLPSVSLVAPALRSSNGHGLLNFGRLQTGKQVLLPVIIENTGDLPAHINMDITECEFFKISKKNSDFVELEENLHSYYSHDATTVINPGKQAHFQIAFSTKKTGSFKGSLAIRLQDNEFETIVCDLHAQAYSDSVFIQNLPTLPIALNGGSTTDVLYFGHQNIGEDATKSFVIFNSFSNKSIKFEFDPCANIELAPNCGHLHPGARKTIQAQLKSSSSLLPGENGTLGTISCKISLILLGRKAVDWDDRLKYVHWVDTEVEGERIVKKKVEDKLAEPKHEVIEELPPLSLDVIGTVDYAKAELSDEQLNFGTRRIFSEMSKKFTITNTGAVDMTFNWDLCHKQGLCPSAASKEPRIKTAVPFKTEVCNGFTISPMCGKILAGETATISVKFLPTNAGEINANATCFLANGEAGNNTLDIKLTGEGLIPDIHFSLPHKKSLHGNSHLLELRENEEGVPQIYFEAIGMSTKVLSKVWMLNPTNLSYDWKVTNIYEMDSEENPTHSIRCLTPRGRLEAGRKQLIKFEFSSDSVLPIMSRWKFQACTGVTFEFDVNGLARNPRIFLDATHISYPRLISGCSSKQIVNVINDDIIPLDVYIPEESLKVADIGWKVKCPSLSFRLESGEKRPLEINLEGTGSGSINHEVEVRCDRKLSHDKEIGMNIAISAVCHEMKVQLSIEDQYSNKYPLKRNEVNKINLNKIEIHDTVMKSFVILNECDHPVEYSWILPKKTSAYSWNVEPETDVITNTEQKRTKTVVGFTPHKLGPITNATLTLQVAHGIAYTLEFVGTCVPPGVKFSFFEHNFGPTFLFKPGMPDTSKELVIENHDLKEISVEMRSKKKKDWYSCEFAPVLLRHRQKATCKFVFRPTTCKSFTDTVEFVINGLSVYEVTISGKGVDLRLELRKPIPRGEIRLGAIREGQSVTKVIPIVNRSSATAEFQIVQAFRSEGLNQNGVIEISPDGTIKLEPKESIDVAVTFAPNARLPAFKEHLLLECMDISKHFLTITGACHAVQVSLDQDAIPFAPANPRSSTERRLIMSNTGDIGVGFEWDTDQLTKDFSINPLKGYLSAGNSMAITVTFHPKHVSQDIRCDAIECKIEGSDSLFLTLTGTCVPVNTSKEQPTPFQCLVRSRVTKSVSIRNPTAHTWTLSPIIDGINANYWSGPEAVSIEPYGTRAVDFVYHPLSMLPPGRKHNASVFFPLPDGNGLHFPFVGHADAPKPIAIPTRDVPCKTKHIELLKIENWLRQRQRLRVSIEMVSPDKLDASIKLHGPEYIDVPALDTVNYELTFSSHKEGNLSAKLYFKNEVTNEYILYMVKFKTTQQTIFETISMNSLVRNAATHNIQIFNPMQTPAQFQSECKVTDVSVPSMFTIPPQTKGQVSVEYLPLKVGESSGRLIFTNPDLGIFQYDLNLSGIAGKPESPTYFETPLGQTHSVSIKFMNLAKKKTEFNAKLTSTRDFQVERTIAANASSEVIVEVTFDPSAIGSSKATLILTSFSGGEFQFPLIGKCTPPKPQGPFFIKARSSMTIPFRNVLTKVADYRLTLDNPAFTIIRDVETIKSKRVCHINIHFENIPENFSGDFITGKLTITSPKALPGTSWEFYLKGQGTGIKDRTMSVFTTIAQASTKLKNSDGQRKEDSHLNI